jgi:hypothetical protein
MKFIIVFIILLTAIIYPQEINCKVSINYEALPIQNREIMKDFAGLIESYINKTKFTSENFDGEKIECTFNIFFTSASGETNYNAQLFIGSQRPVYKSQKSSPMLTILDNNWSFFYERGQSLYQNQSVYDPITSFLDFYAYLVIGYDLDSFEEQGGTQYFSRAMDIVNLGAAGKYSAGWQKSTGTYSRRGLVEDLLNEKYRPFRESFFNYHFNGIDLYTTSKLEAQNNIAGLVNTLEQMRSKIDINSILIKTFFDAKHGEIIDYLKDYPNKDIFQILRKIDPQHAAKYDEAIKS